MSETQTLNMLNMLSKQDKRFAWNFLLERDTNQIIIPGLNCYNNKKHANL